MPESDYRSPSRPGWGKKLSSTTGRRTIDDIKSYATKHDSLRSKDAEANQKFSRERRLRGPIGKG